MKWLGRVGQVGLVGRVGQLGSEVTGLLSVIGVSNPVAWSLR